MAAPHPSHTTVAPTIGPTVAPTGVLRNANVNHMYSFTPLTTIWTPPASCATNIPTIYAGTCRTTGCSAYAASALTDVMSNNGAYVNYPQFSANGIMTSTACMPPGYMALESYYFTPATACPSGFNTATSVKGSVQTTVACCPEKYPTATWLTYFGVYDCYTVASITAGQPFTVMAHGLISTSASDLNGWFSESLIGSTTYPTPTTAYVFHPGVNLILGSTGTPSGPGSAASSSASAAAFSVFSLGLAASIGILIAIGICGCCLLGCCLMLVRRLANPRRNVVISSQQQQPPPTGPTVVQYGPPGASGPYGGYGAGYGGYAGGAPPPSYGYKGAEQHTMPA